MGIKIVYIFLIFERKWRAIPFSSIRIIYELCYQTHPSFFFISNQTRRRFQQLQSCVYKTIIYKHIPKCIQRIQFTHWNGSSGIPFVANISM